MPIQAVVASLDNIDEALKPLYAEHEGRFYLDLDDTIREHTSVAPLRNAHERTKADATAFKSKATDLERQLAEIVKTRPDEATILSARKALEDQIAAEKTRADTLQQRLTGVTIDRSLDDALAGAGISEPTFMKAARAMLSGSVRMDGDKAVIETDMGPIGLADHVKRWAATEGKVFVAPAKGGGATGNDGKQIGGKTMAATAFSALSPTERAAVMAAGTTLTD